jgi:hypothetical protein
VVYEGTKDYIFVINGVEYKTSMTYPGGFGDGSITSGTYNEDLPFYGSVSNGNFTLLLPSIYTSPVTFAIYEYNDGSAKVDPAQGYDDSNYSSGTMGIVTTDRPSSYSGLLIDNGYIRVNAADKSQIDSAIGTYQNSSTHSKGIITSGPTLATPIAPINMGYAVTEVLRNMRYLGYSYDELKNIPGSICSQPMKMECPGLKNESYTSVGTDYMAAEITGELSANTRTFPTSWATSITITSYDTWTPPSIAAAYSRDYELYFTTAPQEYQDLSGHPFTLTLPEETVLVNEVEFEPETTYFIEIKYMTYGNKYFCRITPIKPWGATTVGGQTFSYDKNEQCVEMTPVQGGN